jgi:membrane protein DedA with SNARE-associated domain
VIDRLVDFFRPYMADWGYLIVGTATLLENSVAAGLIVPGETIVLVGGFYSAIGRLDPVWVGAAASVDALLGDNLGYAIGRRFGRGFLERHGRLMRLTPERLARADSFYAEHGGKTVFLGRFVPIVRSVGCLLAGVGHMRYPRFALFDAAGALVWAVGHTILGYVAGASYERLDRYLGPTGLLVLVVLVLLIAASVWLRRRRRHRDGQV